MIIIKTRVDVSALSVWLLNVHTSRLKLGDQNICTVWTYASMEDAMTYIHPKKGHSDNKTTGKTWDSTDGCSRHVVYEDGPPAWLFTARRDGPASGYAWLVKVFDSISSCRALKYYVGEWILWTNEIYLEGRATGTGKVSSSSSSSSNSSS
jgi:hypothetical protein